MNRNHLAAAAAFGLSAAALAGSVDFTEFGYIPDAASVLLDSDPVAYAFSSMGLYFEDSTYLSSDIRFLLAGGDVMGITNHDHLTIGGRDMTVGFVDGATSVTFDWLKLTAETFEATAYDAAGNIVDYFINDDFLINWGSATLTGDIAKVTFNDRGQRIGVGSIAWDAAGTVIPLPTAGAMSLTGLALVGARRRR
jgi:hypothetical protein